MRDSPMAFLDSFHACLAYPCVLQALPLLKREHKVFSSMPEVFLSDGRCQMKSSNVWICLETSQKWF